MVFSGCAANAACRAAYLDLRTCLYDRVHALRRDPVVVDLPVEGRGTVSFTVDGDVSLDDVSLCSGDPFCAAELPGLLDVTADGADPTGHDAPIPETYFRWAIVRMSSDGTALIAPMGT